jgi:hypothetical protein
MMQALNGSAIQRLSHSTTVPNRRSFLGEGLRALLGVLGLEDLRRQFGLEL